MFASAGLSARVLRTNRSYSLSPPINSGTTTYPNKKKKKKVPFQCYVPFLWSTCIGTILGILIMTGGCAMCVVGYYADHYSSVPMGNATFSYSMRDETAYFHLRSLTYIGPILMGIGCFIIVVACVVICETRDKVLRARAEEDPKRQKRRKKLDAYDLILDKVQIQQSVAQAANSKKFQTNSPTKSTVSKKSVKTRSSLSSPLSMGAIGRALVSIPMDIFSVEVEKAKLSNSQSSMSSPASPKSNSSLDFNITKLQEKDFKENISHKSRTLPLDRRKSRIAVTRLVPSDKIVPLYDANVVNSPPVSPGSKMDDTEVKSPKEDKADIMDKMKEERAVKNDAYSSEDEITISHEPVLNQSANASIATEESFLSLGLKNRIMNRTDIPAISENTDHQVHPITVVVQASIHSDNGESKTRPPDKDNNKPLQRQNTKESGVGSASSSRTISPVGLTQTRHGSTSDDDSLHLTEEMLRNFDTKAPSPVV